MGKYFGTDGFRGEANVGLTADHAYKVGRFLGWYYGEGGRLAPSATGRCGHRPLRDTEDVTIPGDAGQIRLPTQDKRIVSRHCRPKIVIGKDTRRSSYMFEYALAAGITASGGDAYLLHVTTTPSVAYITRMDEFDCGVMISASHNVFSDNGIKLLNAQGEKMDDATIALLEQYLDGGEELPFATGADIGRTVDYVAGRNRYVGYLISLGKYSFKGMKVALDTANGASWTIAKSVFEALGAKVYLMGAEPDGTNINRDCGSTHMESICRFVAEKGMDVGFAYDGDADRCLAVDEMGNVVSGDHILYILAKQMAKENMLEKNTVVTTVMSNLGLYKALEREGIGYVQTKVGDRFVYAYMAEHGCALGGEQSGHIIISRYATTGDGILTSLMVMEAMLEEKKSLSELCKGMRMYPQALKNVRVADRKAALSAAGEAIREAELALGDSGRILVRESGTEPVIRVMVEAEKEEICEMWTERIARELIIDN